MDIKILKVFKRISFLIFSSLLSVSSVFADVIISEIMPCNVSTKVGDLYNFRGWVEFYNDGESSVDLNGSVIRQYKKKGGLKWEWTIEYSFVVPAKGYKTIFFDKIPKDVSSPQKSGHSCYKVDVDGGKLELYCTDGSFSELSYPAMVPYLSYGICNGVEGFMEPTPKEKNKTSYADLSVSRCAKPVFSGVQPGAYPSVTGKLTIKSSNSDSIYYTTNGKEPTPVNGKKYKEPIEISKTKVIRARAYGKNMLPSEIMTSSFIAYGEDRYKDCTPSPVVSIVADSSYFYGDNWGIYVVGNNGIEGEKDCVKERANYNQDWDRPVNLEYYEGTTLKFSQEADVAVMGGCSRKSDNSVKSLKMSTGKKFGTPLFNYNPFKDSKKKDNVYASFQLRNGGNAYEEAQVRVRDGFMQSIAKCMGNIDYQAYQPVGFYLDGTYKGIMGLRERTNKDFVFSNYGYEEDEIDVVEITQETIEATAGDLTAYNAMIDYAKNNYTSASYLSKMNDFLDLDEYLNYMIFEQFIVNTDWPGNNYKLWRYRAGGKFRCILYDTDFGLGLYSDWPNYGVKETNMIKWCMGQGDKVNWGNGTPKEPYMFTEEYRWKTILFYGLMQNEDFKRMYLTKSLIHLENALSYENIKLVWNDIVDRASCEYRAKFGTELSDKKSMLEFAKGRNEVVYSQLADFFKLENEKVNLTLSSSSSKAGFFVNNVQVDDNKFSMSCLKGMSVKLSANLPDGYVVKRWTVGDETFSTSTIEVEMNGDVSVSLEITEDKDVAPTIMINEVCSKNTILVDEGTGSKPDWIELYNYGTSSVDVAGFYISDDPSNPLMHKIERGYTSTIIPAKGHLLLWASDNSNYGPLHLGFKLSDTNGETLVLSKALRDTVVTVDKVVVPQIGENNSYGRSSDGAKTFATFAACNDGYSMEATPGDANGTLRCDSLVKVNSAMLTIKSDAGWTYFNVNGVKTTKLPVNQLFRTGTDVVIEPLIDDKNFVSWTLSEPYPFQSQVLGKSTTWRYFYDSIAPSGTWTAAAYVDTTWKKGSGKFGYDTSEKRTYDTKLSFGDSTSNKYMTAYFRTKFDSKDVSTVDSMVLSITYDDGAIVYLNGKELKRFNMSSSEKISYSTGTPSHLDDAIGKLTIKKSDLTSGTNVLAVEVHQYNAQSSDLTFAVNAVGCGSSKVIKDKVLSLTLTQDITMSLTTQNLVDLPESTSWKDDVSVYPNPAQDYVVVNSRLGDIVQISVLDALGRELKRVYPFMSSSEVDLSNLHAGYYLLRIDTKSQRFEQKLLKK